MTTHTYPYSEDYWPPMPVVEVGLSKPGRNRIVKRLDAVVDSGADGTLIPVDMLEEVDARCVGDAQMRGISGPTRRVDVYLASLHIGSHMVHAVRVVAVPEGGEVVLGRNALQHLIVTLNGPASVTEIAG